MAPPPQQGPDSKQLGKQMAALFVALAAAYSIFTAIGVGGGAWAFAIVLTVVAAILCYFVFFAGRRRG